MSGLIDYLLSIMGIKGSKEQTQDTSEKPKKTKQLNLVVLKGTNNKPVLDDLLAKLDNAPELEHVIIDDKLMEEIPVDDKVVEKTVSTVQHKLEENQVVVIAYSLQNLPENLLQQIRFEGHNRVIHWNVDNDQQEIFDAILVEFPAQ